MKGGKRRGEGKRKEGEEGGVLLAGYRGKQRRRGTYRRQMGRMNWEMRWEERQGEEGYHGTVKGGNKSNQGYSREPNNKKRQ